MKRILLSTVGLIVLVMVAFAPRSSMAGAGNGPYYSSPSWDEKLACTKASNCPRFIVLVNWSSVAVLDKETGLVWERSPSTNVFAWNGAQVHCNALTTGGRLGWRLPTLQELASLVDPNATSVPFLPAGHPFTNVQSNSYWSATTFFSSPSSAWMLDFANGAGGFDDKTGGSELTWCVRGGQGVDPQ